jgi:hypothetical protein
MGDLSDFEKGHVIGVHLAGAPVIKTAAILGASRVKVSKVMSSYTNHGKTTLVKWNGQKKSTLTERDCRTLRRTVLKYHKIAAAHMIAGLNIHLEDAAFIKTVRCVLHKSNIHGKAAIAKPLITDSNAQMCK